MKIDHVVLHPSHETYNVIFVDNKFQFGGYDYQVEGMIDGFILGVKLASKKEIETPDIIFFWNEDKEAKCEPVDSLKAYIRKLKKEGWTTK